ncbi:MAG TPA: hypothetical protein VK164_04750 [Flavobacterium sp.]|uniref:hypothetical protein n=1 Tax=Flavobacterium sp. TaxID=239 RepID=UPI002B4B3117|nr:hypothetical protein [Flavobacterium sp.]HLO73225.1 hypothetical protein [Flavobacterium sp.]
MMKKNYFLLFCVFGVVSVVAQVPSINVTATFSNEKVSSSELKKLDSLNSKCSLLKDELSTLKGEKSNEQTVIAAKESQIKGVEAEIKKTIEGNYFYQSNLAYYTNQLAKIEGKITKLKADMKLAEADDNRSRMDQYEGEIQALERDKGRLEIERDRKLNPATHNYSWWLPSKDKKYRDAFFEDTYNNSTNKTNYLNAFAVVGSPNGVTGQSELVADNMGMLRITFGTVITASNDSLSSENTRVEALQRLINGGGNFYFDLTAPLLTTIRGNSSDDLVNFYAYANIKAASDIKGYGNDLTASTYNTSLGLNLYSDISSENKKFNFFMVANASYYYLATKAFYEALQIDHTDGFLSGKITIGVTLLNQFRFSANVATFGSEASVRSTKIGFGLQFLPNL